MDCPLDKLALGRVCATDEVYVALMSIQVLLIFLLVLLVLVTLRPPMRIEDCSTRYSRTIVRCATPHGFYMYGRSSFVAQLRGTGQQALDQPEQPVQAKVDSREALELLLPSAEHLQQRLDTSRGFISLPLQQEVWHRGWPFPLAVWLVLSFTLAVLLPATVPQEPEHTVLGVGVAIVMALACRALLYRRSPTTLDTKLDKYRRELVAAHGPLGPQSVPRGPGRAVELRRLFDIIEHFNAEIQDRNACYMQANIFGPLTEPVGLSYAELAEPKQVQWFVSHHWGGSFLDLCKALQNHADTSRTGYSAGINLGAQSSTWSRVTYWICLCSNNHKEFGFEQGTAWCDSSVFRTLQSCKGLCMVLDDTAQAFKRTWCMFELLHAVTLERDVIMCTASGTLNQGQGTALVAFNLARRISHLDFAASVTWQAADKQLIQSHVMDELGFLDAVNGILQEHLQHIIRAAQHSATQHVNHIFGLLNSAMGSELESSEANRPPTPAGSTVRVVL